MKIGVVAPVWFPVPPTGYGGIEWVVWLLAEGLVEAGHDVTLFASGESRTKAKLEYVFAEAPSEEIGRTFTELHHLLHCYARQDEFDLINDHTGLMGLSVGGALRTPVAHTVHGPVDGVPGPALRAGVEGRAERRPDLDLDEPAQAEAALNWIANCPNALDFDLYPFAPASRRLPALRRPHGAGQGRAPRRPHGDRGGPAAEALREDARAARDRLLRRVRPRRT